MTDSFEEVFEAEFGPLHRYLQRRVGAAAAEDLSAATFATAYLKWSKLEAGRPVRPWLYGIAANHLRHHWRSERRMLRAYARGGSDPVLAEVEGIPERVDAQANKRALAEALASLRREDRELLLLHAWADLSDAEIAGALGLPIGTVKSRLYRARERMRNRLEETGQSGSGTVGASRRGWR